MTSRYHFNLYKYCSIISICFYFQENKRKSAGKSYFTTDEEQISLLRFERPYASLFLWAVLNNMQEMAMCFWREGCDALSNALIACKLYKSMANVVDRIGLVDEIEEELESNGRSVL